MVLSCACRILSAACCCLSGILSVMAGIISGQGVERNNVRLKSPPMKEPLSLSGDAGQVFALRQHQLPIQEEG
jgi:hypothetical protein